MNEFENVFSNNLIVPDKCRECPAICAMESNIADKYNEVEDLAKRALFASPRTARSNSLDRNKTKQLSPLEQDLAAAFDAKDRLTESYQAQVNNMSGFDCAGPITCVGMSPLGTKATITVCGSGGMPANTRQESTVIHRNL